MPSKNNPNVFGNDPIAPHLPRDPDGRAYQITPNISPLNTTKQSVTDSGDTTITLQSNTTFIRVTALANGMFMDYDGDVANTDNDFSEYIPADNTFDFVVPDGTTKISFEGDGGSGSVVVIEKGE